MPPFTRWLALVPLSLGCCLVLAADAKPPGAQVPVTSELERLMREFGFEVRGIERTKDAVAHSADAGLPDRLHLLLENFDHVIVQTPSGGVERVIILGEKAAYVPPPMAVGGGQGGGAPAPAEEIVLATQRQGSSHSVTLTLEGPTKQQVQQSMLIDTGADRVVLPLSVLSALGMSADSLTSRQVQTANGMVDAQIGQLSAILVGERRVENVEAAFIDDQRLGGTPLLGMSLLGRFRMTIDDEKNQLTLGSK